MERSQQIRGHEERIISDDLDGMVINIQKKEALKRAILPAINKFTNSDSVSSKSPREPYSDPTSRVSKGSTTIVVRGFLSSSSYQSIPLDIPSSIPKSTPAGHSRISQRKNCMFVLGGPSQSGEDDESSSLQSRRQSQQSKKKSTIFTFGSSSGEEEGSRSDEDDEIDESAIDDDDDYSDWEDSIEESGKSSFGDKTLFQRVDSRPNLASRRSLITTMLHQSDRAAAFANAASKSTPALHQFTGSSLNGPYLVASPDSDDNAPRIVKRGPKPRQEIPQSVTQPISMNTGIVISHQAALSPKTTRRNILQTELTASLRRHLLWERQQKNQTAAAVLKKRHTAYDVANLKQYPEVVYLRTDDKNGYGSWNKYFVQGLGDFNSKGW